jgi:hypothetical protein
MTEPTNRPAEMIYEAMGEIMRELPAIGKNHSSAEGRGFRFRGIDDVYNALNPLLAKYGVFMLPQVTNVEREERVNSKGTTLFRTLVTVDYAFVSSKDQSRVNAVVVGEAFDSGDKSMSKALAIAHKYALFQIFAIPTEEWAGKDDPDSKTYDGVLPQKLGDAEKGESPARQLMEYAQARGVDPGAVAKRLGVTRFDGEKIRALLRTPEAIDRVIEIELATARKAA